MFFDKKSGGGARRNQGEKGESVAAKARREREARAANKLRESAAITLQRFLRGRFTSWRTSCVVLGDFDAKLRDVTKIATILKERGVTFVPPPPTSLELIVKLKCAMTRSAIPKIGADADSRLVQLCSLVLTPSLLEPDASKSILPTLSLGTNTHVVSWLGDTLLSALSSRLALRRYTPAGILMDHDREALLSAWEALVQGMPSTFSTEHTVRAGATLLHTLAKALTKVDADEHARLVLTNPAAPAAASSGVSSEVVGDRLANLILNVSEHSARDRDTAYRAQVLVLTFLYGAPMLTYICSERTLLRLVQHSWFESLVTISYADDRFAEMTRDDLQWGIPAGLWVLGNLSTLLRYLCHQSSSTNPSSGSHIVLLRAITKLLRSNFLPAVVQGHSSAVLWAHKGVSSTGTALPYAVLQQLWAGLYSPDVVRTLMRLAIRPSRACVVDKVLDSDAKDIEAALNSTALNLTRATMVEQTAEASRWFSTKWAQTLAAGISEGVGSFFRSDPNNRRRRSSRTDKDTRHGDTSDLSMGTTPPGTGNANVQLNRPLLSATLCLWGQVVAHASFSAMDTVVWRGVSALAFSTPTVCDELWAACQCVGADDYADLFKADLHTIDWTDDRVAALTLMAALLRVVLSTTDDGEIYDSGRPLPLLQLVRIVRTCKRILFRVLRADPEALKEPGARCADVWAKYGLVRSIAAVLRELHSRWVRRPFSSATLWEVDEAKGSTISNEIRNQTPLGLALLHAMPWCIQLRDRLKISRDVVDAERFSIQGGETMLAARSEGIVIKIQKSRVLEDGMRALDRVGVNIKERIIVRYVNQFGVEESGIDIGGLFKDFWVDLSAQVFDPNFGLFVETNDKALYPNPSAPMLFDAAELPRLYRFVGMILGKAIFENIVVGNQFAHFFLSFLSGRYNFMHMIDDLSTLDPELYRNLMFLKSYDGDVGDLCLTFSVTDDAFGGRREVDLVPNGSNISVTSANRIRYCSLMAKYYLHDRLEKQARAFFQGLYFVIQPELLAMFCAPELQVLISGASAGIDVDDFKAHCQYAAGYSSFHRGITRFWKVVGGMSDEDRALLLKFVTSCERPPSLGFSALHPPFTIQYLDGGGDERLPSASTCFNVLKLPSYSSSKVMRDKLLLAIRSKSGFDLS